MTVQIAVKIWPKYYDAIADGDKNFEVRVNDRDYINADYLKMREWCPKTGKYTGRVIIVEIISYFDIPGYPELIAMRIRPDPIDAMSTIFGRVDYDPPEDALDLRYEASDGAHGKRDYR